jgi:hypothetical protein
MPFMLPGGYFFLSDRLNLAAVAQSEHILDEFEAFGSCVLFNRQRHKPRDGLIAAGDDEFFALFDFHEKRRKMGFGLGDFDMLGHVLAPGLTLTGQWRLSLRAISAFWCKIGAFFGLVN